MSDRANWVLRWVHEEDLDFNEGDHDWEEPTVEELVRELIRRAIDPAYENLFYWEPTAEYPTQHNFMFEGVVSDE